MSKKVLQIDGGGLKGVIPAVILANFEKVMGKPCCEIFDLITGTSTGAIIGGILASGCTPAKTIRDMYIKEGPKLFTPRTKIPFIGMLRGAKYDRKPFLEKIKEFTQNKKMKEAKTQFMATAFNLCSDRTHYIYSDDSYEENYPLWQVISWSALSAVAYFGMVTESEFIWDDLLPDGTLVEDVKGACFQDGGQGINNCTLNAVTTRTIAKKWFDEGVTVLSLGCGDYHERIPYEKAEKQNLAKQIAGFLSQARNESTPIQYMNARYLSIKRSDKFNLVRVNCNLPKKVDMLDGVKYIDTYESLGKQMMDSIPFELFK